MIALWPYKDYRKWLPDLPIVGWPYKEFENCDSLPQEFILGDHLYGFDQNLNNKLLDILQSHASKNDIIYTIHYHEILNASVVDKYPNLKFLYIHNHFLYSFTEYNQHPIRDHKNFICSFNGTGHVSRRLLVSIIKKFGWYDHNYVSKNFSYDIDILDGNIKDYSGGNDRLYRKFFVGADSDDFFQTINSFGHNQNRHNQNIYTLENKLSESFLHVVSETLATSYHPFVTEKFLYSVVTRGLFLAYAQPGWHDHLEKYYGFKKYNKLFDYKFDTIQNPVERLVELMSMISKFSVLSPHDWHDLYLLQQDEVEYNYDHYFSKDYMRHLNSHG